MPGPLLALVVVLGQTARISDAQAALDGLDYPKALELSRKLLASGTAGADETWRAHAVAGQAEAAMGRAPRAAAAFARALSLHPGWSLPPDASPRLTGPFNQAKAQLGGHRLTAAVEHRCLEPARAEATVRPENDTEGMVHGVRLRVAAHGSFDTVATAFTQRYVARWSCAEPRCEFFAELLDEAGNVVLQAGTPAAQLEACEPARAAEPVIAAVLAPAPPSVEAARAPFYQRPGVYFAAVAALGAGATVVFVWRFDDAQRRLLAANVNRGDFTRAEVDALDGSRRLSQGLLIGALAVAVLAAALSVWWW